MLLYLKNNQNRMSIIYLKMTINLLGNKINKINTINKIKWNTTNKIKMNKINKINKMNTINKIKYNKQITYNEQTNTTKKIKK